MKVIESRRRRLNVKLLLILFLASTMIGLGVDWWHARQVRVAARQLFERGMAAREVGNYRLAVAELGRYVGFVPDDTDALTEYTSALHEIGTTRELREQVFALNEEVLRRRPEEMKIRAVQAELALELSRIPDAAAHVDTIEKREELTANLWYIRGRCFEANRDTDKAIDAYEHTLRKDRDHVQATDRLADLLATRKNKVERANQLLSDLVARTGSVEALLLRSRRYASAGKHDAAIADLREAVRRDPANSTALSAFAAATHRRMSIDPGRSDNAELRAEALTALRDRMQEDTENTAMRLYFARLLWLDEADRDEAIAVLRAGTELEPNNEALLFSLIDSLVSNGQLTEARRLLPRFGGSLDSIQRSKLLRARLLMVEEKWEEASLHLAGLISTVPRDSQLMNRARLYEADCLRELDRDTAAANTYERTLADNPDSAAARLGLAESYLRNNRIVAAINEYRRLKTIPRVAAFLADLLIEAQTTELIEERRWREIAELVDADSGSIPDPIERAILRADMKFARGETQDAWQLLIDSFQQNPTSPELLAAIDYATSILLDRVLEKLAATRHDPEANAAFDMIVGYWATRPDNKRLAGYFEQWIGATGERGPILERMALSVFAASRLAVKIDEQNAQSAESLRQYSLTLSERLVKLDPAALGQRLQLLAYLGQGTKVFAELESASSPDVVGRAIAEVVPFFYSEPAALKRLTGIVDHALGSAPDSPALQHAQGVLLSASGEHDSAIAIWRNLHSRFPADLTVAHDLALLLAVQTNEYEESSRVVDEALVLAPNDVNLMHAKACVQIASGDLTAAQKTLKTLVIHNTHLPHLVHLSYTQSVRGLRGEAKYTLGRIAKSGMGLAGLHPLDRIILEQLTATQ